MQPENHRRRGGVLDSPAVGLASAIAGGLFIPYALSKGYLTSVITADGWQVASLTSEQTAQAFHVLEGVPLLIMAIGLVSLHARTPGLGSFADTGISLAVTGFALTILTHLGEHLLPPLTVPALTGGADWFMWGYYLSWLVLYAGLTFYGLAVAIASTTPRWVPWLFVFALPVATAAGVAATALDVFTVAGTFRLTQGLTWVLVGNWLWRSPAVRSSRPKAVTAEP